MRIRAGRARVDAGRRRGESGERAGDYVYLWQCACTVTRGDVGSRAVRDEHFVASGVDVDLLWEVKTGGARSLHDRRAERGVAEDGDAVRCERESDASGGFRVVDRRHDADVRIYN